MRKLRNIAIGIVGSIVLVAGLATWLLHTSPYAAMILETTLSGTAPPRTFDETVQAYRRNQENTAFWSFRRLAEAGDYAAMARLAFFYEGSRAVDKDVRKARELRRTAADHGNPEAEYTLGWNARYHESDHLEARYWFERAAWQGLSLAQFELAQAYEGGWTSLITRWKYPPRKEEALKWYKIFSSSDSVNLSSVYQQVHARMANLAAQMSEAEVARALTAASQWKATPTKSVAITLPNAVAALDRGDYSTADRLLRALADQGSPEAQYKLGDMYERGLGQPTDLGEAMRWYRKAADQGLAPAQISVGLLYTGRPDQREGMWPLDLAAAESWYRKAADQGDTEGMVMLAVRLFSDRSRASEAVAWLRRAADKGSGYAQFLMGQAFRDGSGVPQNYVQAHMWLNLAAAASTSNDSTRRLATDNRDRLATKMTPGQIAEAQKLASEWKAK